MTDSTWLSLRMPARRTTGQVQEEQGSAGAPPAVARAPAGHLKSIPAKPAF